VSSREHPAVTKRRKRRKPRRAAEHGIDDDLYEQLLASQDGGCALCGNQPKRPKKDGTPYRLQVDHNHRTGKVRGLLCYRCNRALPTYATSEWLAAAYWYVKRDETGGECDVPDQWADVPDQWGAAR